MAVASSAEVVAPRHIRHRLPRMYAWRGVLRGRVLVVSIDRLTAVLRIAARMRSSDAQLSALSRYGSSTPRSQARASTSSGWLSKATPSCCIFVHHGIHTGELMGLPATNREFANEHIHILRFEDDRAVEHWGFHDHLSLMHQLGARGGSP